MLEKWLYEITRKACGAQYPRCNNRVIEVMNAVQRSTIFAQPIKEPLINCPCGRIAALRGTRSLGYPVDIPRLLRSVRLALYPAQTINQRFLSSTAFVIPAWAVPRTIADTEPRTNEQIGWIAPLARYHWQFLCQHTFFCRFLKSEGIPDGSSWI